VRLTSDDIESTLLEIAGQFARHFRENTPVPFVWFRTPRAGPVSVDEAVGKDVRIFVAGARSKGSVAGTSPEIVTARGDAGGEGDQSARCASHAGWKVRDALGTGDDESGKERAFKSSTNAFDVMMKSPAKLGFKNRRRPSFEWEVAMCW
jgi:hypothetical protein